MKSLKGHLLVAKPSLTDPNFARTVLLMFEHNEEGAAGVILNRPTEATVSTISEQVLQEPFLWEKAINLGGPVPGPLMVLHTVEDLADQEILRGIYSCVEAEKVRQLIRSEAEPSLIIANYAGWGPGQLEGEFALDSWLSLPAEPRHVFWDEPRDLWDSVIRQARGIDLSRTLGLDGLPADPSLN